MRNQDTTDQTGDTHENGMCGNGIPETGELCDSTYKPCASLNAQFISGNAFCLSTCQGYDLSDCVTDSEGSTDDSGETDDSDSTESVPCGNGIVEAGETCDTNGTECTALDAARYESGFAPCSSSCQFDLTSCVLKQEEGAVCGNSVTEGNEVCDNESRNCPDIDSSYESGMASCLSNCAGFDTASCVKAPVCGNGKKESGEECDGNSATCSSIDSAFAGGTAQCMNNCSGFDTSSCIEKPVCGNGQREDSETCDGGSKQCSQIDSKYVSGNASCNSDCSGYNTSTCQEAQKTVYAVTSSKCSWCGRCDNACSEGAISRSNNKAVIDPEKCSGCGDCYSACPRGAIYKK